MTSTLKWAKICPSWRGSLHQGGVGVCDENYRWQAQIMTCFLIDNEEKGWIYKTK